jgi:hypothetical protein
MKRKTVFTILVAYLLVSGIYLLAPGEAAWAVPGQNPNRQSSPTRTPTPAATPAPGTETAPPAGTSVPQPPSRPLPLPAETVTPLFLTLFPPTATPQATPEGNLWPTETVEERTGPTPGPSPMPGGTVQPTPLSTSSTEVAVAITPVIYPSLGDAIGAGMCVDLLAIGAGLVILVVGLILVGREQTSSLTR